MPIRTPAPFFDSVAGDRIYQAADFRRVFHRTAQDGVIKGDEEELQVFARSPAAMAVEVGLGSAFIQGGWLQVFSSREVLSVPVAHPTNPRLDRVVVRLNVTDRTIGLFILQGTPAVSPIPPPLTRSATIWELSLAHVLVLAGASQITSTDITDERSDPTVCGVAASPSAVRNVDGVPGIQADILANRPAANVEAGRIFIQTDGHRKLYRSTGSVWEEIGQARVSARVGRNASQSINAAATAAVQFNIERWNIGGLWSSGNPTRLTASEDGVYQIVGNARVSGSFRHEYKIRLNGSTIIAQQEQPDQPIDGTIVATQYQLSAGDYVELVITSASSGPESITSHSQWAPEFMMTRIG